MERFEFDKKETFLSKLEEIVKSGKTPKSQIEVFTPYPVHETEHLLDESQSGVRFFAGAGATTGFITGFAFTIFTVIDWSLITGGKPLVSIPAFLIIAYELTILFGCLTAFVGFLHLGKVPVISHMFSERELSDKFIIEVGRERVR
jgi:hypothetical protein